MFRPPEVSIYELSKGEIGCQWSREADVWALACVVCCNPGQAALLHSRSLRTDRCWSI